MNVMLRSQVSQAEGTRRKVPVQLKTPARANTSRRRIAVLKGATVRKRDCKKTLNEKANSPQLGGGGVSRCNGGRGKLEVKEKKEGTP